MNLASLIGICAVFVLIAINGFFVAAEFALVKVRTTRINQLVAEGNGAARVVQKQVSHLDTYIAATQLGITLASLALGWIGEPSLAHLIEPLFAWIAGSAAENITNTIAIALSFAIITFGHIILGELVPKAIALQRDERTALFVARPLALFAKLFHYVIVFMNAVGNYVVHLLGLQATGEDTSVHSPEELEMLVLQSHKAGVLEQQEADLIGHVLDFEDTTAHQVLIPRTEVVGISANSTFEEVHHLITSERFTRYPVYEGTIDTVIGMVHLKDLVTWFSPTSDLTSFSLRQLIRPILAVPETTSLGPLLTQMQRERKHLAVVIDEYGATAGIVTLEDILEELVGEVQDEFDTPREGVHLNIEVLPDGSSSVDGLLSLADFEERFGVKLPTRHVQTLGGFILEQEDRIPEVGDTLQAGPYKLRVEAMDGRRVARLNVKHTKYTNSKELSSDTAQ